MWTSTTRYLFLILCVAALCACQRRENPSDPFPTGVVATLAPTFTTEAGRPATEADTSAAIPTDTPELSPTALPNLPPADRLTRAREADRLGLWEEAEGWYRTLEKDRTYGHAAMFYLGDLYERRGRLVEAASAWTAGLTLNPSGDFAAPMAYRLGKGLAAVGQYDSAITLYERADDLTDAADAVIAQRLAESYEALNDRDAMVAQWERLYDHPTALRANRSLTAQAIGNYYAEEEAWEEATTWYKKALALARIDSYRADLTLKLGDFAQEAGETGRATAYWQAVLDDFPGEDATLSAMDRLSKVGRTFTPLELGDLYYQNDQYARAMNYYIEALEVETHPAEGHIGLANAAEGSGNLSGAVTEWEKIIQTHPESAAFFPQSWYNIGRIEAKRGDATAAIAAWDTVVNTYPDSPFAGEALWSWGVLERSRDNLTAAQTQWDQLAAEFPDHPRVPDALWASGLVSFTAGDYPTAQATFTQLTKVEKTRPTRAFFWVGKAAAADGDSATAHDYWRRTVAYNPDDYSAMRARDLLAGDAVSPRGEVTLRTPDAAWQPSVTGEGLPDGEPWVAQGKLLYLMGEPSWANESMTQALTTYTNDAAALWDLTLTFHELGYYELQSRTARRLMSVLDENFTNAPPDLLAYIFPMPYAPELVAATDTYDQNPLFVAAIIYQESRWQVRAQSSAAASGLMQVIPDTGRWIANRLGDTEFRLSDLYRPLTALRYGTYYLDFCLDQFDDNPVYALAAYNGGPGNARKWATGDDDLFVERVSFGETRSYVELIYTYYHGYTRAYLHE